MEWESELEASLTKSVRELPNEVGILFSGGLDSSLIAYLSKKEGKEVRLYACGSDGSHDSIWATIAAKSMDMKVNFLSEHENDILEGIRSIKQITGQTSALSILIELPLYFTTKSSTDHKLATGQGADELFLGYKKYETKDTSKEDLHRVVNYVVPMEQKIASYNGKELLYPYLHESVVDTASRIPYDLKVQNGSRKYILRSTASRIKLDMGIVWKQKKAAQYSSGFKDAVARMAKRKGKNVHDFINEL